VVNGEAAARGDRGVYSGKEDIMPPPSASSKKSFRAITCYQLKITLRGSKPPIWRRILVPADCALESIHYAIQAAMGWYNSHLHAFEIGGQEYSGRMPFGDQIESEGLDAARYRLCDVVREKSKFSYQYDFGDSWDHTIIVEKIVPPLLAEPTKRSSQPFSCLAGKGACPPEDCGGIWGYYNLLHILQNPKHEEHEEMKEWAGKIDPDAFDIADANNRLSRIRRK
jgi:hypothetical protein